VEQLPILSAARTLVSLLEDIEKIVAGTAART
jgi:hypothetical protein